MCHQRYKAFFARQLLCISYFDCVTNEQQERWKSQICWWCWLYGVKYRKKLLQTTIPLRKWIQLKVYSHTVKNVWVSCLILVMIFWWTGLAILRSHGKVYQNFIFNFEDIWKWKFVFYQALMAFFYIGNLFNPER